MKESIIRELDYLDKILASFGPAWNLLGHIDRIKATAQRLRDIVNASDDNSFDLSRQALLKEQDNQAIKQSIVDTVGGHVEGQPTNTLNYLQRLRELVIIEKGLDFGR